MPRSFFPKKFATATIILGMLAGASPALAAPRSGSRGAGGIIGATSGSAVIFGGGFGGGYSPSFYGSSSLPPAYSSLPNHWWAGYYGDVDPRGIAYNPSAGYDWTTVTTLLLETFPAKARVTLDGVLVGTADLLGPFQLPLGEHTLRIEAAGFTPSETVLKVEKAVVQQLSVRLSAVTRTAKPAPK